MPDGTSTLRPYVPRIQLQWLAEDPGRTVRRLDGTVVFVDISGFTRLSERLARRGKEGAEQVTDTIGTCFAALLAVAYEGGGGLLKFGGDALLLLFWGEGHTARAVRSAVLMRRTLRSVGRIELPGAKVNLRMSVGIHSGRFHLFMVGGSHREFLITGPAATRTVQMEQIAEAGEIVVSPETASALPPSVLGSTKDPGVLVRREPPAGPPPEESDPDPPAEDLLECLPVALREHVGSGAFGSEHRPATVAFIHYDGTDGIIDGDGPDAAAAALDELVRDVQHAVDAQGVCFLGSDVDADGGKLILTAGAPRILGEDEERMLLALHEIARSEGRLPVRIGVNHGPVFAGDVGPPYRRTYTVMGDTVNLAARLMAKAAAGEIYATASVLERSKTTFETVELEPFLVKGKARPVRASAVGRPIGSRGRDAVPVQRLPLVGRSEEFAELGSALGSARSGHGRLVELVGEPGMGKTRLVEELLARARGSRVLHANAEAYTSSTPYSVWRDLLRGLMGLGREDTDDVVIDKLYALVNERDPDLLPWLPLIAMPFHVALAPTLEVELLDEEFRRSKLHEAILDFLRLALQDLAVIVIEDAHLMDDASVELLSSLVPTLPDLPWLIVATRRDEEAGFVAGEDESVMTQYIGPLSAEDALALAIAATEDAPLLPHDLRTVVERSGGNPQYLLDLVRVIATGSVLPESVETAAMARIDQLPPEDRALIRRASVLGVSFRRRWLTEVLDEGTPDPEQRTWERLGEFFEDDAGGHMRFRRAVVRDAAYAGLPFRTRRALHAAVGERLEREAEDVEEAGGILSLHFFLAGDHARAWRYALIAGRRAASMYANVEAAQLYRRALDSARELDVSALELSEAWEALGRAKERIGEPTAASAAYGAARRLLGGDAVHESELMLKQAQMSKESGNVPQALRWISRAITRLEGIEGARADRHRAKLAAYYGWFRASQGRFGEAERWGKRAIGLAQAVGDDEALAHAYQVLDIVGDGDGDAEQEPYARMALALYEKLGDLTQQAWMLNNLGVNAIYASRFEEALGLFERATELLTTVGHTGGAAQARYNVGDVLLRQGRLPEAETALREALRVSRSVGDLEGVAFATRELGRAVARQGRHAEALSLLEEAGAGFRDLGAKAEVVDTDGAIAECRLLTGEPGQALSLASDALERARELGAATPLPAILRIRGYALLGLGRPEEAEQALREALRTARSRNEELEVALALRGLARLTTVARATDLDVEARSLLDRLGVVSTPDLPGR